MNTIEINSFMKEFKCFKGTFAKELLPIKKYTERPLGFIINTDTSDKPGQHWVALFIDSENNAEYFDSFGMEPLCCEINKLLKINNVKQYLRNTFEFQSAITSACGVYCVVYLKCRCNGMSFARFSEIYSGNKLLNDIKAFILLYIL